MGEQQCLSTSFFSELLQSNHTLLMHAYSQQAPVAAVLALGAYLAARLVHGVLTFPSLPEEQASLKQASELDTEAARKQQGHWVKR